ncbi:MAG: hypothetical protein WCT77_02055, partial [Bacteroidota bacterium]
MKKFILLFLIFSVKIAFAQNSGWDDSTRYQQQKLKIAPIIFIKYSIDGKTLCTVSSDNFVRLWDVKTGSLKKELFFSGKFSSIDTAFKRIVTISGQYSEQYVSVYNIETSENILTINAVINLPHASFTPTSYYLNFAIIDEQNDKL